MRHPFSRKRTSRRPANTVEPLEPRTLLAAADLDATFGTNGMSIVPHPGLQEQYPSAALTPDGRLVLAGTATGATTGEDFVVVRLTANGILDTSFNRGAGKVQTDYNNAHNRVQGLAVQPDGKIIVVGSSFSRSIFGGQASGFLVTRYRVDGTLDTTFGTGGRSIVNSFVTPGDTPGPADVLVQPDGKIVIAGSTFPDDYVVARLLPNGQLDPSFGGGDGKVAIKPEGAVAGAALEAIALGPKGELILAGRVSLEDAGAFAVIRLNSDGSPDATFGGGDGRVSTSFPGDTDANASAVGVYGDGKIVAAGFAGAFDYFALARFNPDGTPDNSFSSDGFVITNLPGSAASARSVQILSDGRILAAGTTGLAQNDLGAAVVRYNYNGSLDTSFSGDGILTTKYGLTTAAAYDLAVRSDGRFIVAGLNYEEVEPYEDRFFAAQYQGGTAPNGAWIAGRVFDDRDRNNQFNTGDLPLPNARVFIDADNDDTYDPGEKSVLTDAEGSYAFTFMQPGDYHWGVVPPAGYEPYLSSGFYSLPLAAGQQLSGKDLALVPKPPPVPTGTPGNDTLLVRLDPSRDFMEIYDNATAAGAPVYRGQRVPLDFDLLAGDDLIIIDATNGNPIWATSFTIVGGAGHDTLRVVGSPAADPLSLESGRVTLENRPLQHQAFEDIQLDGAGGWDTLAVLGGAASLRGPQAFANLTIHANASLSVTPSGGSTLQLQQILLESGAKLDLHDNELVVRPLLSPNTILARLRAFIAAARNATPRWSEGLTTSDAADDPLTGLALRRGHREPGEDFEPFIVRHAYNGDTNLDGRVNADDYFAIDQAFLAQPANAIYAQGDFNYDGKINADDYFLIDQAFLGQRAPLTNSPDPSPPAAALRATTSDTHTDASPRRKTRRTRTPSLF